MFCTPLWAQLCLLQWRHVSRLCVSPFRLKRRVKYETQNKTVVLPETQQSKSYGGSWTRAGKIRTISNYKDTDISMRGMETFMVLDSGWLDGPVWVALERHCVGLHTVSIPLDGGCETGWQRTAASPYTDRRGRGTNVKEAGVEKRQDTNGGDIRWKQKRAVGMKRRN